MNQKNTSSAKKKEKTETKPVSNSDLMLVYRLMIG
jgi:hypothetical protein